MMDLYVQQSKFLVTIYIFVILLYIFYVKQIESLHKTEVFK